jgi:hypothetical protein
MTTRRPWMLTLHDDQGRPMFAFGSDTDPYEIVVGVAWAWADGRSVCNWPCPSTEGSYCLDCHITAYSAAQEALRRREAQNQ